MKNKQKKGISLIVLVITIIVMIVLAGAIILSVGSGKVISKSSWAKLSSDRASLQSEYSVILSGMLNDGTDGHVYSGLSIEDVRNNEKFKEWCRKVEAAGSQFTVYGDDELEVTKPSEVEVRVKLTSEEIIEFGLIVTDGKVNNYEWINVQDLNSSTIAKDKIVVPQNEIELGNSFVITIDQEIETFNNVVKDNGNIIDPKYYEVKEGSTIITISGEYTKNMTSGAHTIGADFTNGTASCEIVVASNIPYAYKNVKYVINGSKGNYIIINDEGVVTMYDRLESVVTTIPAALTEMKEYEFSISGTGTEYDNTYLTLSSGKYIYVVSNDTKMIVGHKEGTCNHIGYNDNDNNIYSGKAWYDFYDSEMNQISLKEITNLQQLKGYTLRCKHCFGEIPFRIYDDSDYLYLYNAYLEPQLDNSKNINALVDCEYYSVNGWAAIPFDYSKTNNLYSEIEGKKVTFVEISNGITIPKTIKYLSANFNYFEGYNYTVPENIEYTYLGTKNEYMTSRSHPAVKETAYENIQDEINHSSKIKSITVHCTDGDIVLTK